jgi:signal transduction histidine kinase
VKYNRDGGRATVQLSGDDETVTIVVSDTGFGLSEEQAAKLFQDFVRIKTDHTRNITGSGLGLSTVKKVAQLYSGAVRVDSTPDQGSTFTVTLPRNHDPDAEKANDARRNSTLVTRAE